MLRLDDLQYKGLKIYQDTEEFCFGTDAVLLAAFATLRKGDRIADLCSGTGVVALLASARCAPAHCLAVELQMQMAELAMRSVAHNGLESLITIRNADIKTVGLSHEAASMDAVLCNPPYQKAGGALHSDKNSVNLARHEIACTLADVAAAASRLLRSGGRFAMVHQCDRTAEIFDVLRAHKLEPKRLRIVQPRREAKPNLLLIESVRNGRPGLQWEPTLVLCNADGTYTKEVKDIYHMGEED